MKAFHPNFLSKTTSPFVHVQPSLLHPPTSFNCFYACNIIGTVQFRDKCDGIPTSDQKEKWEVLTGDEIVHLGVGSTFLHTKLYKKGIRDSKVHQPKSLLGS